jgi:hypothetical protein
MNALIVHVDFNFSDYPDKPGTWHAQAAIRGIKSRLVVG